MCASWFWSSTTMRQITTRTMCTGAKWGGGRVINVSHECYVINVSHECCVINVSHECCGHAVCSLDVALLCQPNICGRTQPCRYKCSRGSCESACLACLPGSTHTHTHTHTNTNTHTCPSCTGLPPRPFRSPSHVQCWPHWPCGQQRNRSDLYWAR
jgi:hypothetical protein